jgi:hypothetical protein
MILTSNQTEVVRNKYVKMGNLPPPSKAEIVLNFSGVGNTVIVSKVLKTEVISLDYTDDYELRFVIKGKYASATYVLNVKVDSEILILQAISAIFVYDLKCIVREDGNTLITITATKGPEGPRVKFSDIRSYVLKKIEMIMEIIAVEQEIVSQNAKAINFDFQTIESTDKIRNINVYSNNNGGTDYYDNEIPVQVTMGTISNLSNSIGDFVIDMKLTNGKLDLITKPSFVVDYMYDNNRISIICTKEGNPVLRVKITKAIEGVPPLLVLVPYYAGNVIYIDFVGTIMRTVPNYTMEFSLLASVA